MGRQLVLSRVVLCGSERRHRGDASLHGEGALWEDHAWRPTELSILAREAPLGFVMDAFRSCSALTLAVEKHGFGTRGSSWLCASSTSEARYRALFRYYDIYDH